MTVISEPDDPQIAVLLAGRISIADLGPDHRRPSVNSKDFSGQSEDLVRAFPFFLPHPLDRGQAVNRLFVGGLQVDSVGREQVSQVSSGRVRQAASYPASHRVTVARSVTCFMVPDIGA